MKNTLKCLDTYTICDTPIFIYVDFFTGNMTFKKKISRYEASRISKTRDKKIKYYAFTNQITTVPKVKKKEVVE